MPTNNPLIEYQSIPDYNQIQARHVPEAVEWALKVCEEKFSSLEKSTQGTWQATLEPLEELDFILGSVWGPVSHLMSVRNAADLRAEYEKTQPKIVQFGLRLSQSRKIYDAVKKLTLSSEFKNLTQAQKRIATRYLQGAEQSGVALDGDAKKRFNEIATRLSDISTKFSNNVLDANKAFSLILTKKDEMDGVPEHLLDQTTQSGDAQKGPWKITLEQSIIVPFMENAKRRDIREKLYFAQLERASTAPFDNQPLIREILALRLEKARLLGFSNYGDLSTSSKMAGNAVNAKKLLETLLEKSHRYGKKEFDELTRFAKNSGQITDGLKEWDIPFYSQRMKEQLFSYKEEELLPYFPLTKVLEGLFSLVQNIFDIRVKAADGKVPTWHPDVRFFEIFDSNNKLVASFFLDPYSRPENKKPGAWMNSAIERRRHGGELQLPIAILVCNGTPPVNGKPSLMPFYQVTTLFHEFGHGLQHMLTRVDEREAAGINNIEWDAVELPSQFMENWAYLPETLKSISAHIDTQEPLPDAFIQKIIASKNYRAASAMLRQLEFGLTDLELHSDFNPSANVTAFDVHKKIQARTSFFPPRPENRFLCSFSHIFSGGYSAGYYSYKWAEVLSADAFSAFEEVNMREVSALQTIGKKFRETILALGGSLHPSEVFRMFRGRDPSPDALLRHQGLSN